MLQQLIIQNYAIIDNLTLLPGQGLNIVTGETGAGKSIVLGALSLILGERADSSVLIQRDKKCIVEAHFHVKHHQKVRELIKENGLDDDDICILRREIAPSGKSRAFINDSPVTLNTLQAITVHLVDLQQQWAHLELEDNQFLLDIADAVAACEAETKHFHKLYQQYQQLTTSFNTARQQLEKAEKENDYKQYLFHELEEAAFKEGEIEEAETELKKISHAEKIRQILGESLSFFSESHTPILPEIKKILQRLESIADVLPELPETTQRLHSTYEELKDIVNELTRLETSISYEPDRAERLQERIDLAYRLYKKHQVNSTAALLEIQQNLIREIEETSALSSEIQQLQQELEKLQSAMQTLGNNLHEARSKAAVTISEKVTDLLKQVGMPNAVLKMTVTRQESPTPYGYDQIALWFDANKNNQFLPIQKAASGGEMSRIMLCIKSMTASLIQLPTLIFDEVDAGISGEAAWQVANLLAQLGKYHQIICITHQPQVAAQGETHFYVYKDEDEEGKIRTQIKSLSKADKVQAIAQMIGGNQPGTAALEHAKEMLSRSL